MSLRHLFARAAALALAATVASVLVAPAAHAESPADVCGEFPHRQVYTDDGFFRAPAWRYGRTVTIVYETDRCAADVKSSGEYVLTLAGTAKIYGGDDTDGRPIDKRPFSSLIRAETDGGILGWPVDWWSCFEGTFSYVWSIPDVYTFGVAARDGRWLMYQRAEPDVDSSLTRFDGCRAEEPARA